LLSAALSFFVPHNAKRYYTLAFPGYCFDMKFNHLIVINDPLNPLIEPLTRNRLWQGLVLRAEQPMRFVPHLDQCDLLQRTGDVLQRELRYGTLVIRDEVTFVPQQVRRARAARNPGLQLNDVDRRAARGIAGGAFRLRGRHFRLGGLDGCLLQRV